jgi:hypothetical protein
MKDNPEPSEAPQKIQQGFFARLNQTLTEVGIKHYDDDQDWDARVKLPQWQLARLKARHAERQATRLGAKRRP